MSTCLVLDIEKHNTKIRAETVDEFMRLLSEKGYYDIFEYAFTISRTDLLNIERQLKEQGNALHNM